MSVSDKIWVEKYRPQTLDDIVGHEEVVKRMRKFLDTEDVPHVVFAGKQGIGKTAIIQAFAKEKYGVDNWRNNILELNASDERGIDTIRDKVKNYAVQGTIGDHQYKIVFLDEADQLTKDAQTALRRIMEDHADVTRFFLSCNYLSQIIGPIQSRCAPFSISPLTDDDLFQIGKNVAEEEGIAIEDDTLTLMVNAADGDARKLINSMQAAVYEGEIDANGVNVVVSTVDDALVEQIVNTAVEGDLDDAMRQLDVEVLKEGVPANQLCDSFLRVIKKQDLPGDVKAKMLDKVAETNWRAMRGANPHVQFHSLLADLHVARYLSLEGYER
ncbi:replication factor C small subunit [Haloarcula virus HVTV-2]|uniref:Replication factor C small subunit n=1 Tax=Haloarcula vallismortis tailed virus 1 TaxID=1262528 RepID=L7TKF6_9CAUD|nr:clamp loader of DNA polymerase [Haloarcula vallismortis tailed virus 1]AGC34465.1 replication factor C small subunit [Haloarcula vallismortis tailed virus 1]UBF22903.1 replication factor C small subunit [Haloarcula virus HVTV-2]